MEDVKQLVVVVDGTAAMGPYWSTICTDYLNKIIRRFCSNASMEKKESAGAVPELGLVVFYAHGPYSPCLAQQTGWMRDKDRFLKMLSALNFTGGGFNESAIAEGLADALVMFPKRPKESQNEKSNLGVGQRHCILVAASSPFPLPRAVHLPKIEENSWVATEVRLADAETVAKVFPECFVSLSVISTKKFSKLREIYSAGNCDSDGKSSPLENVKNPQFLVLLSDKFLEAHAALKEVEVINLSPDCSPVHLSEFEHKREGDKLHELEHFLMESEDDFFGQVESFEEFQSASVSLSPRMESETSLEQRMRDFVSSHPEEAKNSVAEKGKTPVENQTMLNKKQRTEKGISTPEFEFNEPAETEPIEQRKTNSLLTCAAPNGSESSKSSWSAGVETFITEKQGTGQSMVSFNGKLNAILGAPVGVQSANNRSLPVITQIPSRPIMSQGHLSGAGGQSIISAGPPIPVRKSGNGNNQIEVVTVANTANNNQQEKHTKAWEGKLSAVMNAKYVEVCKLMAFRKSSIPKIITDNWPKTIQMGHLFARSLYQNYVQVSRATGRDDKEHILAFLASQRHEVLEQLRAKDYCSRIRLPTNQSIVFCATEKEFCFTGTVYPGEFPPLSPVAPSRLQLHPPESQPQQKLQQKEPDGKQESEKVKDQN